MNSKKFVPLKVFAVFLAGLLAGKFCFSTTKEGVGVSLFNGKPSKLQSVINLIGSRYVDDIDVDSLTELVIPDIFLKLDPHTKYISSEKREQSERSIKGQFCGVGVEYTLSSDSVLVVCPLLGGPCAKAGILPGDYIVKVDSAEVSGMKGKKFLSDLFAGKKGSTVVVGVKRQGTDSVLTFKIVRDDIQVSSVPAAFMTDSVTGYVKITSFGEKTYSEFLSVVFPMRNRGVKNLIVDLRDNGGGLLYAARDVVSEMLLTGDTIVRTVGRDKETELILSDTVKNPVCRDMRIVCLTNYGTASASEILSGAVQDNDRGVIIGRRTFGKGLVQTPVALSDNSIVRLTTSRYYTPSGRSFQKSYADYSQDYNNRLYNGEFDSAGAYRADTSRVYFTKGGRKVYAGGGVMPDLFVPESHGCASELYSAFDQKGLFSKFAARKYNVLVQRDSSLLNGEDFVSALCADEKLLIAEFLNFAAFYGVKTDTRKDKKEIAEITPKLLSVIKAYAYYVAGNESGFYEWFYTGDSDIDSARAVLNDTARYSNLLKP
jgi:carboxyl-terminal processing protease